MSKRFFWIAFALGVLAVAWVAMGFIHASGIALAMTGLVGGVYLLGAYELRQYRIATAGLAAAVAGIPQPLARLGDWLDRVPPALRTSVRLRIEGERVGLPGPALTPYLVGLLVMLGMLGTFLGMVVTFQGAVFAMEGSTDLQAIRGALAEPIKGLGLAFGTSVAGVAASAMLGLMSAIARRERIDTARQLDARIADVLLPFSLGHQRQQAYAALQRQAGALPEVAARLDALVARIDERSRQLDEKLAADQARFHREAAMAYTGLADRVGAALQDSLAAGARAAGDSIRPVVESAMARIEQQAGRAQAQVGELAGTQLAALLGAVETSLARTQADQAQAERQRLQAWSQALQALSADLAQRAGAQADRTAALLDESAALVRARTEGEARWAQEQAGRMDALAGVWRSELAALREQEDARGQAAVERLGELQAAVVQHLATLGAALEAPIARLLHTASEVPQAAAGVITQLRQEMGRLSERDNAMLQERAALLDQLRGVLQALQAHTGQAADLSTQAAASALELASLGEAFGHGVEGFQASSAQLGETLQRIEASLARSTARSDEQLAYYVAQAREVIDLSIASQQGIVEHMRQLQGKAAIKPIALAAAGGSRG